MKKTIALTLLLLACWAWPAAAEEFGTVPLREGGQKLQVTGEEMILKYNTSGDVIWEFYKAQFASMTDIKYTDRGNIYTIEDVGSRPWRRIAITKTEGAQTTVTIAMLTWKWIIIMLILRFMGIFVVLMVLFVAMSVATNLIKRWFKEDAAAVS